MKTNIMITIEEEDLILARTTAIEKGLTVRGGNLGPEPRGNVAALIRALIHEEVDRMILDREALEGDDDG
jgi:hypothetical protein